MCGIAVLAYEFSTWTSPSKQPHDFVSPTPGDIPPGSKAEARLASCRAEMAIIVALLHDVIDDTNVGYAEVESTFGEEIAKMVQKVSELSSLNQLLRRNRRHRWESATVVRPHPSLHFQFPANKEQASSGLTRGTARSYPERSYCRSP